MGMKKVVKAECVNYMLKKMGTALTKLVDEYTEEVTQKTGKIVKKKLLSGRGKLRKPIIEKLTDYYGKAIRRNVNKTVKSMRDDIMATFFMLL